MALCLDEGEKVGIIAYQKLMLFTRRFLLGAQMFEPQRNLHRLGSNRFGL